MMGQRLAESTRDQSGAARRLEGPGAGPAEAASSSSKPPASRKSPRNGLGPPGVGEVILVFAEGPPPRPRRGSGRVKAYITAI